MKSIIISIVGFFVLFGCEKEKVSADYQKLIGTWQWRYTTREEYTGKEFFFLDTLFPNDVGFNQSIVVKDDGTVNCFQNDKLFLSTRVSSNTSTKYIQLVHNRSTKHNNFSHLHYFTFYISSNTTNFDTIWIDSDVSPLAGLIYDENFNKAYFVKIK